MKQSTIQAYLAAIALGLVKDVDKEGGTLEIVKFLNLFKSDD